LPLMLISRYRKRASLDFDPVAELKLPSMINRILEKILQVELFIIENKVSLPVGGSLLIIAMKP
ncbi:SAM-dependent methyltransferase, partial [Acinetobacter baumannii]